MDTLLQDLRYGFRALLKNRGFTATAVIALALGIGANTTIFTAVNALVLKPLQFPELDRLLMLGETNQRLGATFNEVSPAAYLDWQTQSRSFENLAAYVWWTVNLTGSGLPERLQGFQVTPNFFETLRVNPAHGRAFRPGEARPGQDQVVIISDGLWRRRFGADRSLIGKTIVLNARVFTVIGVTARNFYFPAPADLWVPLTLNTAAPSRRSHFLLVFGRLKPGVSPGQAEADLKTIAARAEQQYPNFSRGWGVAAAPLYQRVVGEVRSLFLILLTAVGLVLLIACANVANLLLARGAGRRKEISIRTALGAGRVRLIRQLLTESVLLSLTGGVLGLLVAVWGTELITAAVPPDLARFVAGWSRLRIDPTVLLFTIVISVGTGILFGLLPAYQATRTDLNQALKQGQRAGGDSHPRLRNTLVVAEVSLALILLVGSGLLIRSFVRMVSVNPGLRPDHILTARVVLPFARYEEPQQVLFFENLIGRISTEPGVKTASAISLLPLGGENETVSFTLEGKPVPKAGETPEANFRAVTPGYFKTMEIALLGGRDFDQRNRQGSPGAVIINDAMGRQFWPGEDPLGKRIRMRNSAWEVVGIVDDVATRGLLVPPKPEFYVALAQFPVNYMTIVVRTTSTPLAFGSALKRAIQDIDKDQPVYGVRSMEEVIATSVFPQRFAMSILTVFAGLALCLAGVGIYGVMAFAVEQRTHEIGVRMALGAQRRDVLRMVIRQGMMLAVIGLAIGLAASIGITRLIAEFIFGVRPIDPVTFVSVSILLASVAFLASVIPALRATRVDPVVALRYE